MRASILLAVLLSAPSLAAQTAEPADPPHVLIETVGPDGWRMRLGPTNLGSMLETEEGKELWQPYADQFRAIWLELAGEEGAEDAALERLLGYGGGIRAAFWLDLDGRGNDPADCIAVVLDEDRRSDLAALADDLRQALYTGVPGEWREVELGGEQRAVRANEGIEITAPYFIGGKLIIAAATDGDLGRAVRRAEQLAAGSTPPRPDSPALHVRMQFGAMVAHQLATESASDVALMTAFGLPAVGDGTITVSTAGPRVQVEYAQQFTTEERGLFAAVMPSTPDVPALLAAAPAAGSWAAGHFDLLKLYDVLLAAIDAGSDEEPGHARQEVVKEAGIDLGPELFAHMTDEVLFCLFDREDLADHPERTPWTLAWRLTDAAAFEQGLMTLMSALKPFVARKGTSEHGDVTLHRYGNFISYDAWLAVGNGVFALSGGGDAEDNLRALLDRCAAAAAAPPTENGPPAKFADLRRHLPPGAHAFARGSAANAARLPTFLWIDLMRTFWPLPRLDGPPLDPDEQYERGEALAQLLERHNLHVARSATGWADNCWTWHLYW